jgi:hypothetical protein
MDPRARPAGPAGVSGYQIVEAVGAETNFFSETVAATCPVGKQAISGGAFVETDAGDIGTTDAIAIHRSVPISLNATNDSWAVDAVETVTDNRTTSWHLVVTAVRATTGS